uniref:NADH-ubiquinone oxidoreductase chain 5 n=1 Tax=Eulimnogammarus vittatus TaxID=58370 RepID=A0A0U1XK20_EULVI|nr:NADH dehydrogenase subunit 5 [Eulimnogammarus vittatus]AIT99450.1 NADH dehydrogenase subunit 5 [Eulimnogammarus vittatus]
MMMGFKIFSVMSFSLLSMSLVMFLSGLLSVVYDYSLIIEWEILSLNTSLVSMSFLFDWMSLVFLGSVCLISGSIMKYSEYYMEGEINFMRFSFILIMFVVSMWLLIISPNMISLLLGWDGLGLTSYALVIYYQNELSCNAGMLTVLSNRVGDVAILMSIALMFSEGSWDFNSLFYKMDNGLVFLVVLACFTKSAQMPFSAWLPAAMAAPTPVSALVHSSTLVTAGVYLLIRFDKIIQKSDLSLVLLSVSVLTMFMAGLGAVFESDMKKVVALSTLSQLGLMIMILSVGMKELAFFHLITHAMFKSSLFMCVGFMIHSSGGPQDSRQMSSFGLSSPVLGVMVGSTNLALCGFPFLAGFYSKDTMLEHMHMSSMNLGFMVLIMGGTGLTVAYSFRMLYLSVSWGSLARSVSGLSDFSLNIVKSVSVLFLASLFMGFLMYWVAVPLMPPSYMSDLQKYTIMLVSLAGGVAIYSFMQMNKMKYSTEYKVLEVALSSMWFLGQLSTKMPSSSAMMMGLSGVKLMDMGWLEYYGGQGGRSLMLSISEIFQKSQMSLMIKGFMITVLISFFFLILMG